MRRDRWNRNHEIYWDVSLFRRRRDSAVSAWEDRITPRDEALEYIFEAKRLIVETRREDQPSQVRVANAARAREWQRIKERHALLDVR